MPMIRKPLSDITKDDLDAICAQQWPEDEQLDFKTMIPHKNGPGADPWRDERRIRDYGRDELLGSVVAFANSYGGDLVVGVQETAGNPGTAEILTPVPDCADAANRLAQSANALIEPPLTGLQVRGVPTDNDGAGVIVMRVARSSSAPHRLTFTKECYQRVRHETLPMTMRQIQDLTFNTSRGLAAIDERFSGLRARFLEWSKVPATPLGTKRMGLRVSCVPLSACYIDKVHGAPGIIPALGNLRGRIDNGEPLSLHFPVSVDQWRPLLRGTGASTTRGDAWSRIHLYCDGASTYECAFEVPEAADTNENRNKRRTHLLFPDWLLAMVGNAIRTADTFRSVAVSPATEYALEVEIAASHALPTMRIGDSPWYDVAGEVPPLQPPYPRYVLGARESWPQIDRKSTRLNSSH